MDSNLRGAREKTLILQRFFSIKITHQRFVPVENSPEQKPNIRFSFDQNELRAMAGAIALIIIILLVLTHDDGTNFNNIILLLVGFFVGGSLLTTKTPPLE